MYVAAQEVMVPTLSVLRRPHRLVRKAPADAAIATTTSAEPEGAASAADVKECINYMCPCDMLNGNGRTEEAAEYLDQRLPLPNLRIIDDPQWPKGKRRDRLVDWGARS